MTKQSMTTSEVLNRAADVIEEHGWTSGSGWPGTDTFTGKFCAEGAIAAALGITGGESITAAATCDATKAVVSYVGTTKPLFLWNDSLMHQHLNEDFSDEVGWVGGSREAAESYAEQRVIEVFRATALIEVFRATALIEAARENPTPTRALTTEAGL